MGSIKEIGSYIVQAEWRRMSANETDNFIKKYEKAEGADKAHLVDHVKWGCSYFTSSPEWESGDEKSNVYRICCGMVDYCSFYVQTWFYALCGVVALLLIIGLIVVSCCCCKKRGGGGKDEVFDYDDGDNSEPNDSTKSAMA